MSRTDWRDKLARVDALMRAVSLETDPQALVNTYGEGARGLFQFDQIVSVSRREARARPSSWPSSSRSHGLVM